MIEKHETHLEHLMRIALIKNHIRFADQIYSQTNFSYYNFDFVVYGRYCTLIVECDGVHHDSDERRSKDAIRDLWSIQHGFQDVLRFDEKKIRNEIEYCINEIVEKIKIYDEILKKNGHRPYPIQISRPIYNLNRTKIKSSYKKLRSDYYDPHYEFIKKYINQPLKTTDIEVEQNNIIIDKPMEEVFKKDNSPTLTKNPNAKKPPIIILHLPQKEQEIFELMKTIPIKDKNILWRIIKNTSKDGVSIFSKNIFELELLIQNNLLLVNTLYKSRNSELSLLVLPNAPYLLRELIRHSK